MILYLHGFRSAPRSFKAMAMHAALTRLGRGAQFHCPQLPVAPQQAIDLAEALLARADSEPTLVGSSLGGYYATWLAEKHGCRAVLLNPAVVAPLSLEKYIGEQTNLYTGERFDFTAQHVQELRALEVPRISRPERYLLVVETGDELLDYRDAVSRYMGANMIVRAGGDHSLTSFGEHLPAMLQFAGIR
ncbi:MAG: alpha/beta fold hydrolase [Rhodocyclaceae bacterium]|nr:alpha/beta fold hydrolase [Rhodocyclaceae bacterium]